MNLSRQKAVGRRQVIDRAAFCVLLSAFCFLAGCGYTTRPGLATHLRTVYIKPLINKIDLTQLTLDYQRFPIYRPGMETDVTTAIINRFQFTGLLRPAGPKDPDSRLEGELVEFRRDALRYNAAQQVEEWRLSVVVNLRFYDLRVAPTEGQAPAEGGGWLMWEEERLTGDATYFALGPNAESEAKALDRATEDLARRVVERAVESW